MGRRAGDRKGFKPIAMEGSSPSEEFEPTAGTRTIGGIIATVVFVLIGVGIVAALFFGLPGTSSSAPGPTPGAELAKGSGAKFVSAHKPPAAGAHVLRGGGKHGFPAESAVATPTTTPYPEASPAHHFAHPAASMKPTAASMKPAVTGGAAGAISGSKGAAVAKKIEAVEDKLEADEVAVIEKEKKTEAAVASGAESSYQASADLAQAKSDESKIEAGKAKLAGALDKIVSTSGNANAKALASDEDDLRKVVFSFSF